MTSLRPAWAWDLVGLGARLLLAAVFLVSGFVKADDLRQTREAVKAYELLPDTGVEIVTAVLPFSEIAVGLVLLLGLGTRIGAALGALLMLVFIFGVSQAAIRGLTIDCGCFGGGGEVGAGETEYTLEILRDVGLLIVSLYLMVRPHSWLSVDQLGRRGHGGSPQKYDDVRGLAAEVGSSDEA